MRAFVIVLVASVLTTAPPSQNVRHDDSSLHYSFEIPANWERIPQDVLQHTFAEVARATGMPQQHYAAGFQRDADSWLAYPYLLVQHHPVNSATFTEIANSVGSVTGGVTERFKDKDMLSDLHFEQPTADPIRQMVLMPLSLNVIGIGPVRGLSVMKPGRDGLVQVTLYSRASEYALNAAEFEMIVNSLAFAPGYEYGAPRPTLRMVQWTRIAEWTIAGAVIGGLVALIAYARRRSRGPKTP